MTQPAPATAERSEFSTDHLPPQERFAFWREECCEPLGLVTEQEDRSAPFDARVSRALHGDLVHVRYRHVSRCMVSRGEREIGRRVWDGYAIYTEASSGALLQHFGGDSITTTGDMAINDLDLPFRTRPKGAAFSHDVWLVPRHALAPHLRRGGRSGVQVLPGAQPTAQLLKALLGALAREAGNLAPHERPRVIDALCRLAAMSFGAANDDAAEDLKLARAMQAKRHIERHLADPALSPASIAAALGVSLRSLHAAFEPTGTTLARHIAQRRLEACRTALLADPRRPVIDIAFAWGFNSLSGFYRAFQAAFGAAPGDLRATAGRRDTD